jgi:hypothetical protein
LKRIAHGHDELLQIRKRTLKADAAHAMIVLECKESSFFLFCSDAIKEIDKEHVGDWRNVCIRMQGPR